MANFAFGYGFVSYTPTASSANASYPDDNIIDYTHLQKQWRSSVTTDVNIVLDFGSTKTVPAVLINDANFAACYIQGNATNVWTSPSFRYPAAGNMTIAIDERVQRYKAYVALTAFNYRYMRLFIPSQTPVDGAAYFRLGTFVCPGTLLTLNVNPAHAYEYSADEKTEEIALLDGAFTDCDYGIPIWQGSFGFDALQRGANETQLWTLNGLGKSANLVFYENLDDTSKGYLCRRRTALEVSWDKPYTSRVNTLTYRELI